MKPRVILRRFLRSRKEYSAIPDAPGQVANKRRNAPAQEWECCSSHPLEQMRSATISLIKSYKDETGNRQ